MGRKGVESGGGEASIEVRILAVDCVRACSVIQPHGGQGG